eukprot:scaffold1242_cov123-Cylindrotheca_fusiformis.AAC.11
MICLQQQSSCLKNALMVSSSRDSKRSLALVGTRSKEASTQPSEKTENEIIEEDWSDVMTSDLSGGFAQHETQEFHLTDNSIIRIASAPSLTPIDMMDLGSGTHDATGHCVWTGARFFTQIPTESLQPYFTNKRILELGSGTGLAGIAISRLFFPKELVLTDSSSSALELCRHNCGINNLDSANVQPLTWGASFLSTIFDTVFATDVLYDIEAWVPLLKTAYLSLGKDGIFILSHVPRAVLPEYSLGDSLESHLISVAAQHHFTLIQTLRPKDYAPILKAWKELEEAGTAVFVFQKGVSFK